MNFSYLSLSTVFHAVCLSFLFCIGFLASSPAADLAAPLTVRDSRIAASSKTGIRIVRGHIELPRSGAWRIDNPYQEMGGVTEVFLDREENKSGEVYEGKWQAKLQDRRAIRERRAEFSKFYWRCSGLARNGDGLAPAKLTGREPAGIHLVPGVRIFDVVDGKKKRAKITEILLIDATPAIGDGKHWIMDCHGVAKREEIDLEKMRALGLKIAPQRPAQDQRGRNGQGPAHYQIYARLSGEPALVTLTARDQQSQETVELHWDIRDATGGENAICAEWAKLRLLRLDAHARPDSPLALAWRRRVFEQYGSDGIHRHRRPDLFGTRRDGQTATAMGVLGGRAAIRETLQMGNLRAQAEDAGSWNPGIPIAEIQGVEVESHPFEKMLDGKPGGRLPLADWIPHDRFMVYFPKPDGIVSLLEGGADFTAASGAMMTGRSVSHQLKDRYLESFGLSENLMKRFLKTGVIEEMALSIPDLFLIDGTEMCVVMRTGEQFLTTALVGVPPGDGMTVKKNKHDEEVYWVRRGSMLVVSTSHEEMQAVLAAKDRGKALGSSAELRYMLTQVPVTPETTVYAYFSDPFIRRLVGPEIKIGQLRRLMARRELENASAGALLARFDGQGKQAFELSFLQEHGYMDPPIYAGDLTLDETGRSQSGLYGSAARMHPLTDLPVETVSEREKMAYEQYLEGYNRFWRRYFDPIAVRYEQHGDGTHQLETFILPLIENSLYGVLRRFLPQEGQQTPIRVPVIVPEPVAIVSVNLSEDAWLDAFEKYSVPFEVFLGLDMAMLDLLGPDVHLAIQDADPIIALGSGELQGLLGQFGRAEDMMEISLMVSMLTRPCTLHIGLDEPGRMRTLLSQMARAPDYSEGSRPRWIGEGSLYRVAGREKWIYRYSLEGLITFRFGIEVQDRYLVINNLPFSNAVKVTGNRASLGGAACLEFNPAACIEQHPALFTSAVEKMRFNSLSGEACLTPMILSGAEDVKSARAAHAALFGFSPVHPAGGSWTWDSRAGELVSSHYGSMSSQQQPGFDPDNMNAGIFSAVSRILLGMQFEDDGLRSTVRWKTKK